VHNFAGRDFVTLKGVARDDLELIFDVARGMEEIVLSRTRSDLLDDKILGLMFFQVSTRTRISFESAMQRLGGGVVGFVDPKATRAGDYYAESLDDTVRMMEHYADVLVIRHPQEGAPAEAAAATDVPVISGGDGYNEHPTQGLLDLYTIQREIGRLDGIRVGLVGNMHGRVLHSLALGLAQYQAQVDLISPPELSMSEPWLAEFERVGLNYREVPTLDEVLEDLDVIYLDEIAGPSYNVGREEAKGEQQFGPEQFMLNRKKLARAKPGLIVLNPLPRTDLLPREIDSHASARYFVQAYCGVAVRMALLALILGRAP